MIIGADTTIICLILGNVQQIFNSYRDLYQISQFFKIKFMMLSEQLITIFAETINK